MVTLRNIKTKRDKKPIRIKILSCKYISQKILIWCGPFKIQFHSEWGGGVGLCQLVVRSVPVYTLVLIVSSCQKCAWQTPALVIAGTGENMAGAQQKWHNFFVEDFKRGREEISLGVWWQQCLFRTQAQAQELKLPLFPEKRTTVQVRMAYCHLTFNASIRTSSHPQIPQCLCSQNDFDWSEQILYV